MGGGRARGRARLWRSPSVRLRSLPSIQQVLSKVRERELSISLETQKAQSDSRLWSTEVLLIQEAMSRVNENESQVVYQRSVRERKPGPRVRVGIGKKGLEVSPKSQEGPQTH